MTALRMQHTLPSEPRVTEDLMELTSDMDRNYETGEDIDIDIDLTAENQGIEEDEYMVEDNNPALLENEGIEEQGMHMSHDDEMADEVYAEASIADRVSVNDENLEDAEYLEPDEGEYEIVPTALGDSLEPHSEVSEYQEQTESNQSETREYHEEEISTVDQQRQSSRQQDDSYTSRVAETTEESQNENKETDDTGQHESMKVLSSAQYQGFEGHDYISSEPSISHREEQPPETTGAPSTSDKDQIEQADHLDFTAAGRSPKSKATSPAHSTSDEADEEIVGLPPAIESLSPGSVTSAVPEENDLQETFYVHSVMVNYQNSEIFLFPPVDQDEGHASTYFLQDERLAGESITKLLGACRHILGESIDAQEELIMDIEALDLHITEFAPESSTTTLLEIVNIYVHLQHYDGHNEPPPLYMRLTTKPRFSYRLEYLMNAIAEEKGLSQIRSSNGIDNSLKLGTERAPSPLDSRSVNISSRQEIKTPQHLQSTNNEELSQSIEPQNPATVQTSPPRHVDAANQALNGESSAKFEDSATDQTDNVSDTAVSDNIANGADGQSSHASQSKETGGAPPPTQLNEPELQVQDAFDIENEDFIDYEDENEQVNETSSGSSTLQGDILNPNTDSLDDKEKDLQSPTREDDFLSRDLQDTATSEIPVSESIYPDVSREQHEGSLNSHNEDKENLEDPEDEDERRDNEVLPVPLADYAVDGGNTKQIREVESRKFDVYDSPEASAINGDDVLNQEPSDSLEVAEEEPLEPNETGHSEYQSSRHEHHIDSSAIPESSVLNEAKSVMTDSYSESSTYQHVQSDQLGPQSLIESIEPGREEEEAEDEITYEDDENAVEAPESPSNVTNKTNSSPGSLKRIRSVADEGYQETENQDSKRFRSG